MSNAFDTTAWAGELVDLAGAVEAMAAQLDEDTPEEQLLGRVSQVLRQRQAPPFDGEIYCMIRRLSRLARMLDFVPNAKTHGMEIHRVIELLRMQSPAPAEGEVAELVELLRGEAINDEINDHLLFMTPAQVRRAADLLERQAAPVPVSVSERPWEREGWCDSEGKCWFWSSEDQCWFWERNDSEFCRRYGAEFECLPAHAMPHPTTTPDGQEGANG